MPLNQTSGNVTTDAYGVGASVVPNYIEDVFSTYLYTGNQDVNVITNGIDLSTKGGMVWIKDRTTGGSFYDNALYDTARGPRNAISSNLTAAQLTASSGREVTSFNTTGFTLGASFNYSVNSIDEKYVSWTFRKQPKFFDVVTWTGSSTARTIAHNLGSVPGCIMVKAYGNMGSLGGASDWNVYHRSLGNNFRVLLNTTNQAFDIGSACWNATTPTSTVFSLGTNSGVNQDTVQYVAYLFAHDAGGFGLTGTDNVISCGSYTGNGSATGPIVTLGYEPQWLMVKKTSNATNSNWFIVDNMRGFTADGSDTTLYPNLSNAEGLFNPAIAPTATGFQILNTGSTYNESGSTYIYIAIRRGPMKVPTDGTKVFSPVAATNSGGSANTITTNFPTDLAVIQRTDGYFAEWFDRLRGDSQATYIRLRSANTSAEATGSFGLGFDNNTGYVDNYSCNNIGGGTSAYWNFRRAPSFFDEVCYTGTGSATTVTHNLGAVPELMIVKNRGTVVAWKVYHQALGNTNFLELNSTGASTASTTIWNDTTPTSSVFTVGSGAGVNQSGIAQVAYLFATCAGVSKVGSYTGTGATQTISCGFAGGARFVLIKRTDSTGDWYVWDTARGMVSGTDPSLLLNSTAAEVNANSIYTTTGGFQIVSTAAGINASGGSFIFFAVA